MSFSTSDILFIVMIPAVVVLIIICILQRLTIRRRIRFAVEKEHRRNVVEIRNVNNDLQRFMYLYEDLKKANESSDDASQNDNSNTGISLRDAEDIVMAQKKLEAEVERVEKKLANKGFVDKAPQKLVDEEKAKGEKYRGMLETVCARLESLKK